MIIVKGRKVGITGQVTPVPSDTIIITIQFSGDNAALSADFANVKYLKQAILCTTWDDSYPEATSIQQVMSSRHYSNGCGQNIGYRAALGTFGHNDYNGAEWALIGKNTYAQQTALVTKGWDLENHSDYHKQLNSLEETKLDLTNFQNLIYERMGYLMNMHVVVSNFSFYAKAAKELGFLGAITQGAKDGLPIYPNNENWSKSEDLRSFTDFNSLPTDGFIQIHRNFTEDWNAADVIWIKTRLHALLNLSNATTNMIWQIGAHAWTAADFTTFMDYVQNVANDRLWVVSRREAEEYRLTKEFTTKEMVFDPLTKVATITLDQSAIPPHFRWRGMTIDLSHLMNVVAVSVNGADFSWVTYGTDKTMINIENERTVFPASL